MRKIEDILLNVKSSNIDVVPTPKYDMSLTPPADRRFALAVKSMQNHTTDEGWQIMDALGQNGYQIFGHGLDNNTTNVKEIAQLNPRTVVLQDKREYEGLTAGGTRGFNISERFKNVNHLAERHDIFKVTILKDAHARNDYHRDAAIEAGIHAWIVYYHPKIVKHLAPFVRSEHLIRTYHTLDPVLVPVFSHKRRGAILSGAVSSAYPLRLRLFQEARYLSDVDVLDHPGYNRSKCYTPEYFHLLNKYKVAICTSSIYGYALRKIIEATACGCTVLTDLPHDEVLPEIDSNLIRVDSTATTKDVMGLLHRAYKVWDGDKQIVMARKAIEFYNYRAIGRMLSDDIESLRRRYTSGENKT